MMKKNLREHAVESLLYVEKNGYIKDILARKYPEILDNRDKRLLHEIVYGTVRNQIYIDYIINKFLKDGKKIQKEVRMILRISLYQLVFLDRIPEHAVVNEAVELSKKRLNHGAASLVNGILRNILRNKENAYYISEKDIYKKLSIATSFPLEWVRYFSKLFNLEELKDFLHSNNDNPPFTIRPVEISRKDLKKRLENEGYDTENGLISKNSLFILEPGGVFETETYKSGFFYVQDEGSQKVVEMFQKHGDYLGLDICAAPGGKTFQLMEICKSGVTASDVSAKRLKVLEENAKRLNKIGQGLDIVIHNATSPNFSWKNKFDMILVDAPCTGMGLVRRKPEIKHRVNLKDSKDLSRIQLKILENASYCLSSRGEIVYSTCTVTREENEHVIEEFLKNHHEFEINNGMTRYWPHKHNTDGFSMISLRKKV